MANVEFFNVTFVKADNSNKLVIRGEAFNNSGRDLNAVAIRIILFKRNIPMLSTVIVVNGLPTGRSKNFEKRIEDLEYEQVLKQITRYEIYPESMY